MAKEALTENITLYKQAKHWTQQGIGQLCLEHCFIWLREPDTKEIVSELFGDFSDEVLEDNGEDKMPRERN